ncbi:MAG: hypothetical protein CMP29_09070 [Roseibacillus sp.]|nr:hypothetical protein [Roseibacillus sp.]
MFRLSRGVVLLGVALLTVLPDVFADERITSFHSRIVVEGSGDLLVTETIQVRAEGKQIKQGIYRDIPRLHTTKFGLKAKKPFEVLSVMRDGKQENYQTESIGRGGVRIRIGRAGVLLNPGSNYTYEISYRTGRQLYFEEERDVLYWNVNGTEWLFPANRVSATVHLPEGIKPTKVWGYTGTLGKQGGSYKAALTGAGATIVSTRAFRQKENLTVALEWPPGLLDDQAYSQARDSLFRDHPLVAFGLILLAGAFLYYLWAWIKVGKDPERGTIIPRYNPPEGLSAAAVRYLDQMGYDKKCFSAGVVGLAAKKQAVIEKEEGGSVYTLHPNSSLTPAQEEELLGLLNEGEIKDLMDLKAITAFRAAGIQKGRPYGKVEDILRVKGIGKGALVKMLTHVALSHFSPGDLAEPLTADENGLHKKLFGQGSLKLKQSNHVRIGRANEVHKKLLATQVEKVHFVRNIAWWVPGLLLSLLGGLVFVFATGPSGEALIALGFLSVVTVILTAAVALCVVQRGKDLGVLGMLGMLLGCGIWGVLFFFTTTFSSLWVGVAALYAVVLNQVFYQLIKAPTKLGQRARDEIEGFRLYLSVAEEERLNLENPPEETPQLFERFLPYALALGCEQQWAEKFDGILQAAGVAPGESSYGPSYYSGSSDSLSGAMNDLSGSFTGSLSSSASAPSSGGSGGGGGGGGSGGGGGGGGGGGW